MQKMIVMDIDGTLLHSDGSCSKEEKAYLSKIITNERRKYIRNNYNYINNSNLQLYEIAEVEAESVLEIVINKCEEEINSALEFEKIISNSKLYEAVKSLSLKEKMVLFSLYKEEKQINQIAIEMNTDRTTIFRIKNRALDKIMHYFIGGKENV